MSGTPRHSRSRSRHATPTPSRPGSPSGSRRPSLNPHNSIPSLALGNASMLSTASPPQLSINQAITSVAINDNPSVLESSASITGDTETSTSDSNILIMASHHGSNELVSVVQETDGSDNTSTLDTNTLKPPEEVAANAQRLRDQLRRSLSQGRASTRSRSHSQPAHPDIRDVEYEPPTKKLPEREFFVLTHAGKPVFTNRKEDVNEDSVTNLIGVMHALISVFEDDNDKIRSIAAPPVRITFVLRPPLYYVCVCPIQEPESAARIYLEHLHLLILSVLTGSHLERILTRHTNFDLRRLLSGTSTMLQSHLSHLPTSFAILTSSLNTLRLESTLRLRVADALVPPPSMKTRLKDILYALVIVDEKVVTIARPKKHTVHPADLQVLLATIGSPAVKGNSASWLPICLPKFNSNGLLHTYASYLQLPTTPPQEGGEAEEASENSQEASMPSICLAIVSASGDFESVRDWADVATKRLNDGDSLKHLVRAARKSFYSVDELGIPGLRHFFYKSRPNVQVTSPEFEGIESLGEDAEEGQRAEEWERLFALYRVVWDAIHAKSGQECTLKLQFVRTEAICVMGWITQSFEIYVALSPKLPKSAAVGAANAVVKWVKTQEGRLFLKDAPVF